MEVKLECLKSAYYFSKLPSASLEDVSRFIFERQIPADKTILWEGDEGEVIYFVISGLLKLFTTSEEGREFIVRIVYGGDSINDDTVFGRGPNILSAMTLSPVVLYGLHQSNLADIIHAHPEVGSRIVEVFAARQRYLIRLATELVFKSATSRLARLLLEKEELTRVGAKETRITQQEMASMIGTVREIVSRSLRDLETMGFINLKRNQIIVTNRDRLLELSKT